MGKVHKSCWGSRVALNVEPCSHNSEFLPDFAKAKFAISSERANYYIDHPVYVVI